PHARHANLAGHLEHFVDGVLAQTDLRIEAKNYRRFRENFERVDHITFPEVYDDLSGETVMTMDFVRGKKVDALEAGEHPETAARLRRAFLKMLFEDGFLHADLHPGNLLVQADGRVAIFDVGRSKQLDDALRAVRAQQPMLLELALGGTAVGTGLNAPDGFGEKVVEVLKEQTGIAELRTAVDSFEAQAARDGLVEASGALKTIAVSLTKIANDIRWMGSGPLTGLGELQLPDLQPGSSIMPGKVNPVIPEAVTQVAAQVIGNDAAVTVGGLSGAFELNVYIPMMARNVLESFTLLSNVSKLFAAKCIDGLVANDERLRELAESSPSIVTPLNSAIGYEEAAKVAKEALKERKTIRQAVIDRGLIGDKLSEEELDKRLDVLAMAKVKDDRR
ncbi:lyase family protein, partial [Mycolicibacterium poriferae]|uniref:lyase family protein n=1 Tax=Mycolicibacterium poriferae TaxID=39694 RepID=UPI0024B8FF85